ncbi:glycine cleavage system protein H [Clostridium carboxidivorans P7]|uniref:Glycine cleavage system H protein n=1 Tax=Clostridium carboxidivorans P7 TaxID=536227 RepID=C6PSC3_9CLOT|nr:MULTISPECIES: glycine cleavage system protein GcvH [Clostridium]AKN33372.1 glycine cleavage system protein H [Clostridium carboxidivorans P7]EET87920.1 glycine cleavage system H protein [Clostridium carboxidivorans P7]EFG89252.1 glycine cleavage system H protein [Clostridium carboxidivorans P7]WPC42160.1 glycine cleavage system protein GcvH [Clostridium sp. JS66]
MKLLENLKYTKDHEWVKVEGDKAYIGITDFAQHSLGDIVFVELPEVDSEFNAEEAFGVVESVKAASDIYMPISGKIVKVNEDLVDSPELVNEDPYENWIIMISISDTAQLNDLLDSKTYEDLCGKEE